MSRLVSLVVGKVTLGSALVFGLLLAPHSTAELVATEHRVCIEEDGSDAATFPCVWRNDGRDWLTFADRSVLVTP